MQRHGFAVRYALLPPGTSRLPYPSLAGTCLGGASGAPHFVAVLGETADHYVIGDPLCGRVLIKKVDHSPYYFTGFFALVSKIR